jgi:penicillin G amidase
MAEALPAPIHEPDAAPVPRRPRRVLRPVGRALLVLLGVLIIALAAGVLWVRSRVEASLAQLDGERAVPGLAGPVTVERDALGVPTIRAASRTDAARALGFLHGQERFFQMDLLRRQAAGELAELFGPAALELDRQNRVHRFRDVARRVIAGSAPPERALIEAYAQGINTGLAALGEKPFEYLATRTQPAPWKPEDTILASFAMFIELHDEDGSRESDLGLMKDLLPEPVFRFLTPVGTEWDAPLVGQPFATPPIPGPEVLNLRSHPTHLPKAASMATPTSPLLGSNNWAVAGSHTADGRALLANDMHLGISVPNTWYRASLILPDGRGGAARITGVTLPGTPAIVVGSNGHVAWGFTNSYGDWTDLVVLEIDPKNPEVYRTPQGPRRFERTTERLHVKGGADETLEVRSTIWGPVIDKDHLGRPRALAWTAHRPESVSLGLVGLETARTVDEALAVAHRSGIPPQNFVVADETGRIAWTIIGRMPRRVGFDGRTPTSWADGSHRWDGWLAPEEIPQIVDPPSGRIWTANARVVDGAMLEKLGDGGYDLGARARQIRDDLLAVDNATPRDLLAIQLDDRALLMERWRKLLLSTLTARSVGASPARGDLRQVVEESWTGHASIGSAGYRLVRSFRQLVAARAFEPLLARCTAADDRFDGLSRQSEGPLWKLVTERPAWLLDPKYGSWNDLLLEAADATVANFAGQEGTLADRTWGERNTTRIRHPLSRAIPFLGRWLDVPPRALPGDEDMPRVQGPAMGASERLVVSPGQEDKGFFHMPVGQSGNPLSPYYQAGNQAWEEGRPTPFLPGRTEHSLRLVP